MLVIMLFRMKYKKIALYAIILLFSNPIFGQKYFFEGDPQLVFEEGNFKQNYNTGLFFFNTNQCYRYYSGFLTIAQAYKKTKAKAIANHCTE